MMKFGYFPILILYFQLPVKMLSLLLLLSISHSPVRHPVTEDLPTVTLGADDHNYYAVAKWLMKSVDWILSQFGMQHDNTLFIITYASLVFLISFGIGWILQWIIVKAVNRLSKHWRNDLYMKMAHSQFFTKISRLIPALLFLVFIQFTLTYRAILSGWMTRITWIYVIYILADSITTFVEVLWIHLDERENHKKLPLKGVMQLIKGIVWLIVVIIVVAILLDKSPASLLAGIGAFAAVLMLVFKDSILGVVAGIQLSENDSLHVGDWIKVPGTDANGIVTEVSLTAVKVTNFDKTVTTLPPYNLVSGSFTNYRPMQASGTRRIMRSYMIDSDSIVPVNDELLQEFARVPLMSDWIAAKIRQRNDGRVEDVSNSEGLADGSLDTNLGIFRAYVKLYLDANPDIEHSDPVNSQCFVCTLPQTPTGVPLQIYCFTNTSVWISYEGIQSAVFEHIAVMMAKFRLYTNENASGRDELVNGVLEANKAPSDYFGIPYPFYMGGGNPANPGVAPSASSPASTSSFSSAASPQESSSVSK